ncbi:MAG: elongation factor Ts, partial [Deferribacterales bacterium]|nr:elongation factor Ts [Deferribacterales bacterium]
MAEITASLVKELREKTGAGMMDCKKALAATEGDIEKAIDFLRTKGLADAAKKSGRIAAEGVVTAYVSEDAKSGAIVEVNSETDFVAKNEDFVTFANGICRFIAENKPADLETLLAMEYEGFTVEKVLADKVAKIGENIKIRRFTHFSGEGFIDAYIHAGGKIGVLVEVEGAAKADAEVVRDVALHICAANPLCVDESGLDQAVLEHEKGIYMEKAKESGKPANIIEKIVDGQIKKFKQENCLVSQKFVKNPDETVAQVLGGRSVKRFVRL